MTLNPAFKTEYLSGSSDKSAYTISKTSLSDEFSLKSLKNNSTFTISYQNLRFTKNKIGKFCKSERIELLHGISGVFEPGLNAIIGPSGSGKTLLMEILAGLKDLSSIEGSVLVNGMKPTSKFYDNIGYVTEEIMLMETLTVQENMEFSATMANTTVKDLISSLGLTHCASNQVGQKGERGISGGERKRCQIGVEMLKQPSILFLDEPTSGLDAHSAFSLVCLLHKLSLEGRTIILSMHQPRYCIFKLFSTLTILSHGHTLFHAQASQALSYFNSLGYTCEENDNIADFLLDVISLSQPCQPSQHCPVDLINDDIKKNDSTRSLAIVNFRDLFVNSHLHKQTISKIENLKKSANKISNKDKPISHSTNFFVQIKCLSKRSLQNFVRNPLPQVTPVITNTAFAVLVGIIFLQVFHLVTSAKIALQNRTGALYFVVVNQMYNSVADTEILTNHRQLFLNEVRKGYYKTSSYFISKLIFNLLPFKIASVLLFSLITSFSLGLDLSGDKFITYFSVLLLVSLTSSALCLLLTAAVEDKGVAYLLVQFYFLLNVLFSGFFSNISSLPEWLKWMTHLSIMKHALARLFPSQLKGLTMKVTNGTHFHIDRDSSNEHMEMLALEENGGLVVLFSFTCVFLIATYACLRCSAISH